jgi:hypothetical protein
MNVVLNSSLILGSVYCSEGIITLGLLANEQYKLHTYEVGQGWISANDRCLPAKRC